jgi:SAM-dependent methyltransferase
MLSGLVAYNYPMRPDIVNLRQFYSSRLGRQVKRRLAHLLREHWAMAGDETIVGIGYATPILRSFTRGEGKTGTVIALMPTAQGAIYWPIDGDNRSVLGDTMRPPFAVNSLSRILMVHAFEYAAAPDELLRITWQLLAPGGRLLLIIPNRHGLWASFGATPFAAGTPYTLARLKELLADAEFTLRDAGAGLFAPPSAHPFWLRTGTVIELLGRWCFPRFGGVLVIEAEKQIYAAIREPVTVKPARNWAPSQGVPA